jgi:hypothetical protein
MAGFSRDRAGAVSPLESGPRSARFHIIDYDVSACLLNPALDLATDRFANANDRTLVTHLRCIPMPVIYFFYRVVPS